MARGVPAEARRVSGRDLAHRSFGQVAAGPVLGKGVVPAQHLAGFGVDDDDGLLLIERLEVASGPTLNGTVSLEQ